MAVKNAYELLQVFPTATEKEIKDAFRFALFRYHPDHNKGREEWAVQRTMELVDAYHILTDPGRRAHHDVMRAVRLRDDKGGKKGTGLFGGGEKAKQADEEFRRGVESYRSDEYEAALKSFGKVLTIEPECANARFNLAACFLALEKSAESLSWMSEYIGKNKDDAEAKALFAKITALQHKRK